MELFQELFDLVEDIRFLQIGPGPFFFSFFPGPFATVSRDDDDVRLRLDLSGAFQHFPSVRLRHNEICDDVVEGFRSDSLHSFLAILDRADLVTLLGEGLAQGPSNQVLIVSDQDPLRLYRFLPFLDRFDRFRIIFHSSVSLRGQITYQEFYGLEQLI